MSVLSMVKGLMQKRKAPEKQARADRVVGVKDLLDQGSAYGGVRPAQRNTPSGFMFAPTPLTDDAGDATVGFAHPYPHGPGVPLREITNGRRIWEDEAAASAYDREALTQGLIPRPGPADVPTDVTSRLRRPMPMPRVQPRSANRKLPIYLQ